MTALRGGPAGLLRRGFQVQPYQGEGAGPTIEGDADVAGA